jgi:hypothetical protein
MVKKIKLNHEDHEEHKDKKLNKKFCGFFRELRALRGESDLGGEPK